LRLCLALLPSERPAKDFAIFFPKEVHRYVSDRDRGAARMRVLERLGITDPTIQAQSGKTSD